MPLLQVRKTAAGKAGGKRRGTSTLLVDDLDNLQIRSRTYRWAGWGGGACLACTQQTVSGCRLLGTGCLLGCMLRPGVVTLAQWIAVSTQGGATDTHQFSRSSAAADCTSCCCLCRREWTTDASDLMVTRPVKKARMGGQQQVVALMVEGQLQPVPAAAAAGACEQGAPWCRLLLDVFRRVAAGEVLVEAQEAQSPGGGHWGWVDMMVD